MLNSGGGRERLGRTTDNRSQIIQGDESVSVLAKTSNDEERAHGAGWGGSISMSQSIRQSSPESISIKIPTGTVARSHPWSDSHWSFGSGAYVGTVIAGSVLVAGRSLPSVEGSGIGRAVRRL